MRVIGLGFAAVFAICAGCQKEQPVSENAKKLSPAQEAPAAKSAAPPTPEEPSVEVEVEHDEADDKGQGEPMDEVDDVSDNVSEKAGPAHPPTESGEDPEE